MSTTFPDDLQAEVPVGSPRPTAPAHPRTVLPRTQEAVGPPPVPRRISGWSRRDALTLAGVTVSSLCITLLLFGRLTPLSGAFGFAVTFFAVFVAMSAVMASFTENGPAIVDRTMTVLLAAAACLALFALGSVIVFVVYRAWPAMFSGWFGPIPTPRVNFFTQDLSTTGPLDPLDKGGVFHAIMGTVIQTSLSLVFTVPLALTCAVFLNESRSKAAGFVRTIVTAMTALPSIVAGLFIFATWILVLGFERSGLAASISISIMMLPIIIRSADVVLRLVPGSLREAAAALGAPQWRTVWHVVLPTARSGLTTSVILGVARGIGETAPVLLTAGYTGTLNVNPLSNAMVSLPLAAFKLVSSPQPNQIARGFGAAAVLMVLVLVLFSIARILGGRPAGRLSKRQVRRRAAQSLDDLDRIERRREHVESPVAVPEVRT
ncbi:MAG: phosphate ABC transporter permease PstA [Actinomycetes bacterium]|jgi:phosphate transport system permease protein